MGHFFDSCSSGAFSSTHGLSGVTDGSVSISATVTDVGQGDVGTYTVRVLDASDDNPSTDASGNITILDKEPTTPGAFNDSTSLTYVGSLALDWNASSYAYQYQIFKSSGDNVFTTPWVPTGINTGVSIFECSVSIKPVLAKE